MPKLYKKLFKETPFALYENVEYQVRDAQGNLKKLWATNALGEMLLRFFRLIVKQPISPETNQVKPGLHNYLAAYGIRLPGFGFWTDTLQVSNLITNTGKAGMASRFNGAGAEALFDKIGIGTGTVAAAAADTALGAEVTAGGVSSTTHAVSAATASRVTTTVTNDTAQLVGTVAITATIAITESAVFNAATAGTMANRQVFSAVNVANGDNFQATHKFAFA